MKKIIVLIILSVLSVTVFGQRNALKSNIEGFFDRSGVLIKKVTVDVDKIKSTRIQLLKYTDLITNEQVNGLRLEGTSSSNTVAYLDADEVNGLIKTMYYISNSVLTNKIPDDYTEYIFKSRSGFQAGAYTDDDKWVFFIQLDKYVADSMVRLNLQEFGYLKEAISKVKEQIPQK